MKKLKTAIYLALWLLTLFLIVYQASAQIRSRILSTDEILNVNSALGIATIIEIPETIQSMIIGDQSAFKVEYLDRAVTIKPLRALAKTNLYLITGLHRFDVRLTTVNQERADYVVYVKNPEAKSTVKWRNLGTSSENKQIRFVISRIGKSGDGFLLFEGMLTLSKGQTQVTIAPEDFWISQNLKPKVIDSLYLSSTMITRERAVIVGLAIKESDLDPEQPLSLELRGSQILNLRLPGGATWK